MVLRHSFENRSKERNKLRSNLLCFQKSVNALLAVRRMSLSPLFATKRRRSTDPSILKSTAEGEEDQVVDRKVSAPIDPAELNIPNRRHGETRSSCFDLDINTIKALQEKADKAMGKVSSQRDETDEESENSSEDENSYDDSDSDDKCSEEQENEAASTDECSNLASRESCSYQRPRASTVCSTTLNSETTTQRERKTSQILISVGDATKNDFKPVSFTFSTEKLQKDNKLISESTIIQNAQVNSRELKESHIEITTDSSEISLNEAQNCGFEPQELTLQLDKSVLNGGLNDSAEEKADELPRIYVNDEVVVTSPSQVPVAINNNIESNGLGNTPSLQTSSSLNIAHVDNVDKISDGVQSITVKLGNLNGVRFTFGHVPSSVRRSSTGTAPC